MDKIKVAIKVRPLIEREKVEGCGICWKVSGNSIVPIDPNSRKPRGEPYVFDHVFGMEDSNYDIFERVATPIVNAAVRGFNGTIFAYGQTSSGKTHTMMGTLSEPGIIPLTIGQMFETISNDSPGRQFLLRASYIEIYNEKVNDLLSKKTNLKLREESGQVVVTELSEEVVHTPDKLISLMKRGEKVRRIGETNMNERSSRSHTIFRIIIESREDTEDGDGAIQVSHLNLVDLAGSERVEQAGSTGDRLKEGCAINRSLFTLGLVIAQLTEGDEHVSYRDSKLTRILQSSIGGNALTAIVCTVTPAANEETANTLSFASRAKHIKNKPHVNEVLTEAALLKRYTRKIKELEEELERARHVTPEMKEMQSKLCEEMQSKLHEELSRNEHLLDRITRLKENVINSCSDKPQREALRRRTWCAPRMSSYRSSFFKPSTYDLPSILELSDGNTSLERRHSFDVSLDGSTSELTFQTPVEEFELQLLESEKASALELNYPEFESVTTRRRKTVTFNLPYEEPCVNSVSVQTDFIVPVYSPSRYLETPPQVLRDRVNYYQQEYDELLEYTRLEKDFCPEIRNSYAGTLKQNSLHAGLDLRRTTSLPTQKLSQEVKKLSSDEKAMSTQENVDEVECSTISDLTEELCRRRLEIDTLQKENERKKSFEKEFEEITLELTKLANENESLKHELALKNRELHVLHDQYLPVAEKISDLHLIVTENKVLSSQVIPGDKINSENHFDRQEKCNEISLLVQQLNSIASNVLRMKEEIEAKESIENELQKCQPSLSLKHETIDNVLCCQQQLEENVLENRQLLVVKETFAVDELEYDINNIKVETDTTYEVTSNVPEIHEVNLLREELEKANKIINALTMEVEAKREQLELLMLEHNIEQAEVENRKEFQQINAQLCYAKYLSNGNDSDFISNHIKIEDISLGYETYPSINESQKGLSLTDNQNNAADFKLVNMDVGERCAEEKTSFHVEQNAESSTQLQSTKIQIQDVCSLQEERRYTINSPFNEDNTSTTRTSLKGSDCKLEDKSCNSNSEQASILNTRLLWADNKVKCVSVELDRKEQQLTSLEQENFNMKHTGKNGLETTENITSLIESVNYLKSDVQQKEEEIVNLKRQINTMESSYKEWVENLKLNVEEKISLFHGHIQEAMKETHSPIKEKDYMKDSVEKRLESSCVEVVAVQETNTSLNLAVVEEDNQLSDRQNTKLWRENNCVGINSADNKLKLVSHEQLNIAQQEKTVEQMLESKLECLISNMIALHETSARLKLEIVEKGKELSKLQCRTVLGENCNCKLKVAEDDTKALNEELMKQKELLSVVENEKASITLNLENRLESLSAEMIALQETCESLKLEIVQKQEELTFLHKQRDCQKNYVAELQVAEDKIKLLNEEIVQEKTLSNVIRQEKTQMKESLEMQLEYLGAEIMALRDVNTRLKLDVHKEEDLPEFQNIKETDKNCNVQLQSSENKIKLPSEDSVTLEDRCQMLVEERTCINKSVETRHQSITCNMIVLQERNAGYEMGITEKDKELLQIQNWKKLSEKYCAELKTAEDKLELLDEELMKKEKQLDVVEEERKLLKESLVSKLESLRTDMIVLQEENAGLKKEIIEKDKELLHIEHWRELSEKYHAELKTAEDKLKLLEEELMREKETLCIVVEQKLLKESLERKCESLSAEIISLQEVNAGLKKEMIEKENELLKFQNLKEMSEKYYAELKTAEDKLELLDEELMKKEKQLDVVEEERKLLKESLVSKLESLRTDMIVLQEENAGLKKEIIEKDKELSQIQHWRELSEKYCAELMITEDKLKLLYEELLNEKKQLTVIEEEKKLLRESLESNLESLKNDMFALREINASLKLEIVEKEKELSQVHNWQELSEKHCSELKIAEDKLKLLNEELVREKARLSVLEKEKNLLKENLESKLESHKTDMIVLQEANASLKEEIIEKDEELSQIKHWRELSEKYHAELKIAEDKLKLLDEELLNKMKQLTVIEEEKKFLKESLEKNLEYLSTDMFALRETNASLKLEIDEKDARLTELHNCEELNERYCAELKIAEDKLNLLDEELVEKKNQLSVIEEEKKCLQESLESKLEFLTVDMISLQEANVGLKMEIIEKEKELSQVHNWQELSEKHCAELKITEGKLKLLNEELVREKAQLSVLEKEKNLLKENLESKLESLKSDMIVLQEENAGLKKEIIEKDKELSQIQHWRELSEKYCAELKITEDKLKLLNEELVREKAQLSVLEIEKNLSKENLESQLESFSTDMVTLQETNAGLKLEILEKDVKLTELHNYKEFSEYYCTKLQVAEDKIKFLEEELVKGKEQLTVLEEERTCTKKSLENRVVFLNTELLALQESCATLKLEISQKEDEVSSLKEQIECERKCCVELQMTENQIKLLNEELLKEKVQCTVLDKERTLIKEGLESRLASLSEEMIALTETNADLKLKVLEQEEELSRFQNLVELNKRYCAELQGTKDKVKLLEEELVKERKQFTVLEKEKAVIKEGLESRLESLSAEIVALQEMNVCLKLEIVEKDKELSKFQISEELGENYSTKLQAAGGKSKFLDENLVKEMEELAVLEQEKSLMDSFKNRLSSLTAKTNALKTANEGLKLEIVENDTELSVRLCPREQDKNYSVELEVAENELKLDADDNLMKEDQHVLEQDQVHMKESSESRLEIFNADMITLQQSNVLKVKEQSQLQNWKALYEKCFAELQVVKEQLNVVEQEKTHLKESLDSKLVSTVVEMTALQESNASLKLSVTEKENELLQLLEQKTEEINNLNKKVQFVESTLESLFENFKQHGELPALEGMMLDGGESVENCIEALNLNIIALQDCNNRMKVEFSQKEDEIKCLTDRINLLIEVNENLKANIYQKETTLSQLQTQKDSEIKVLVDDICNLKCKWESVREENEFLSEALRSSKENYHKEKDAAIKVIKKQIEGLKINLGHLKAANTCLKKMMLLEEQKIMKTLWNGSEKVKKFQQFEDKAETKADNDSETVSCLKATGIKVIVPSTVKDENVDAQNNLVSEMVCSYYSCDDSFVSANECTLCGTEIMALKFPHISNDSDYLVSNSTTDGCSKDESNKMKALTNESQVVMQNLHGNNSNVGLTEEDCLPVCCGLKPENRNTSLCVTKNENPSGNEIGSKTFNFPACTGDVNEIPEHLDKQDKYSTVCKNCLKENEFMDENVNGRSHKVQDVLMQEKFEKLFLLKETKILKQRLNCATVKINELTYQLSERDKQLCSQANDLKNLDTLREQIDMLNFRLMHLTNENQSLSNQISLQEKLLQNKGRELEQLKREHAVCLEKINMLSQELTEKSQVVSNKDGCSKNDPGGNSDCLNGLPILGSKNDEMKQNFDTEVSVASDLHTEVRASTASKALTCVSSDNAEEISHDKSNFQKEVTDFVCKCSTLKNELAAAKMQIYTFEEEVKHYSKTLTEEIKSLDCEWDGSEHNLNDLLKLLLNCVVKKQIEVFQTLEKGKCQCEMFSFILHDATECYASFANKISDDINSLKRIPTVCESVIIKLLSDLEIKSHEFTNLLGEIDKSHKVINVVELEKVDLEQRLQALQTHLEHLQSVQTSQGEEIDALHSALQDSKDRIVSLESELQSSFHRQELLKTQLKDTEENLTISNEKNLDLDNKLNMKERENCELKNVVASFDDKTGTLVKELDGILVKNITVSAECDRLSKENIFLTKRVKELEDAVETEKNTAYKLQESLLGTEDKLKAVDCAKLEVCEQLVAESECRKELDQKVQYLQEQLLKYQNAEEILQRELEVSQRKSAEVSTQYKKNLIQLIALESELEKVFVTGKIFSVPVISENEKHTYLDFIREKETFSVALEEKWMSIMSKISIMETAKRELDDEKLRLKEERKVIQYLQDKLLESENCIKNLKCTLEQSNKRIETLHRENEIQHSCITELKQTVEKLGDRELLYKGQLEVENKKELEINRLKCANELLNTEVREMRGELESKTREYNESLKQSAKDCDMLSKEVKDLSNNNLELASKLRILEESHSSKYEMYVDKISKLESEHLHLQECLANKEKILSTLQLELQDARKKASDMDNENEKMLEYTKELQSNLTALYEEQILQNSSQMETEVALLKQENKELVVQRKKHQECLAQNETFIKSLQLELEDARKKATDLDNENEDMLQFIKELQSNLNALHEEKCQASASQNKIENASLIKENEELVGKINRMDVSIEELRKKCAVLEEKELKLDSVVQKNSLLEQELAKITKTKNTIDKQFQKLLADHRREFWRKTVTTTTVGTNTEVEKSTNAVCNCRALEEALRNLQMDLVQKRATILDLEFKMKSKARERDLEKCLQSYQEEVNSLREQLEISRKDQATCMALIAREIQQATPPVEVQLIDRSVQVSLEDSSLRLSVVQEHNMMHLQRKVTRLEEDKRLSHEVARLRLEEAEQLKKKNQHLQSMVALCRCGFMVPPGTPAQVHDGKEAASTGKQRRRRPLAAVENQQHTPVRKHSLNHQL